MGKWGATSAQDRAGQVGKYSACTYADRRHAQGESPITSGQGKQHENGQPMGLR